MRKLVRAVLVGALTLMLTTACAAGSTPAPDDEVAQSLPPLSELTPIEDPSSFEGPTTAVMPTPSIEPMDLDVEPELPTTVTSHARSGDKSVEVSDVSRILAISLSGSVADYVYTLGLGDNLVGRDVSTTLPGTEDLPVVTRDGHSIDAEAVLALNPTVVITDGSIGPVDVVEQIADAGIPVVFVQNASTYDESFAQAQQVADALGISGAAPTLIENLTQKIDEKEQEIAALVPEDEDKRPHVAFLYMRGSGVFYLFGKGSGVDSLLDSLDAVDVATQIGWDGQRPMNDEALVKANPDTILVMSGGLESVDGVDGMLETHPAVALTNAGKHRRIVDVPDTDLFTGGARIPDILDGLARALYAPDSLSEVN